MARIDSTGKPTRKITVTFPDGTTAVRRSPRDYVAAVIALGPDYKDSYRKDDPSYVAYLNPTKWQVIGWSISFANAHARAKHEAAETFGHKSDTNYYREFAGKLMYDKVHVVPTSLAPEVK